jgi:hypothetical protein
MAVAKPCAPTRDPEETLFVTYRARPNGGRDHGFRELNYRSQRTAHWCSEPFARLGQWPGTVTLTPGETIRHSRAFGTRVPEYVFGEVRPYAVASCLMLNRHGPVSTDTTLYVPEPHRFHEISRTSMTTSPASLGGAGTIA